MALDARDRRQGAAVASDAQPAKQGRRARPRRSEPSPGRCYSCGEHFETYPAWERHADAGSCRRFELDIFEPELPKETR